MSTDWTAVYDPHGYRSSDGWRLVRRDGERDYTWDVVDPDGRLRIARCVSVTDAQRAADRFRFPTVPVACPFCRSLPGDGHYDDCLIRTLTPGDAARLAASFDDRAAEVSAKAAALWVIAGVERLNATA